LLIDVANECQLSQKIKALFAGDKINNTEGRSVLHVALRKPVGESLIVDGTDVVSDVHQVLNSISTFSASVRSG
jgi:glucose-6-phosphate isomerase